MLRGILFFLFTYLIFICLPVQAQTDLSIDVVKMYFEQLDQNNWNSIPNLWVKDQRESLKGFLNSKENQINKIGILNIKEAKLVRWKELPYDYAENYLPSRYMNHFSNKMVYYVGINYKVHIEDQFHINGVNYFFVALALEDGEWKIVFTPHVPVKSIIDDGYGFGTDDEKTFDERRLKFLND
jgi:hypothetical protein